MRTSVALAVVHAVVVPGLIFVSMRGGAVLAGTCSARACFFVFCRGALFFSPAAAGARGKAGWFTWPGSLHGCSMWAARL